MDIFQIGLIIIFLVLVVLGIIILINTKKGEKNQNEILNKFKEDFQEQDKSLRQDVNTSIQQNVKTLGDFLGESQKQSRESQNERLIALEERFKTFSLENEQKLNQIRQSMETNIKSMQEDNNKKLEEMRVTVDDKLQKTLEDKMSKSFALVNERLEQVYKGLGEMQNLAVGVGDLKKVLSNVKTRGIVGEIQLGAILKEILTPEQYEENVNIKGRNSVEFAVKLPADGEGHIYLPIDAKFPGDTYAALKDAYDDGDKEKIDAAAKNLINSIKSSGRDIRDKYINPPYTTDFAIMFLPFEGLYSEVVNRGMVEELQRTCKVNIAGPSTMAALLNSLQMGFKTLAVQKRSAEVWKVLKEVKREFETFSSVLKDTRFRLRQADDELEKLIGVRTRQITRKLKDVQSVTPLDIEKESSLNETEEIED